MLRYLGEVATNADPVPTAAVFDGIGRICEEIEEIARVTRRSLKSDALCVEVRVTWR